MKKLLTVTLSLIFSCSFAQWEWQYPVPQGNTLNDVTFINKNDGWAIGGGAVSIICCQSYL